MGWRAEVTDQQHRKPRGDLVAAYGWAPHHGTLEAYREAGCDYLHLDLGFWERKRSGGDYSGNHKCSLNGRHPVAYFRRNRRHDRMVGGPDIQPTRRQGRHILIAGLSAKGAATLGKQPSEWELGIIAELRRLTDRPLVYRPKPSWKDARALPGAAYSPPTESIAAALAGAWAVVVHYSNVGIDAIAAGIPVYAEDGVAKALSMRSLADIESPGDRPLDERRQFVADVSYCHWRRAEIEDGTMFRQFVKDGLIAA